MHHLGPEQHLILVNIARRYLSYFVKCFENVGEELIAQRAQFN